MRVTRWNPLYRKNILGGQDSVESKPGEEGETHERAGGKKEVKLELTLSREGQAGGKNQSISAGSRNDGSIWSERKIKEWS